MFGCMYVDLGNCLVVVAIVMIVFIINLLRASQTMDALAHQLTNSTAEPSQGLIREGAGGGALVCKIALLQIKLCQSFSLGLFN